MRIIDDDIAPKRKEIQKTIHRETADADGQRETKMKRKSNPWICKARVKGDDEVEAKSTRS